MPAGDLSDGLVTRIRAIYNESSTGFLSATDPYTFLDNAQNFIIDARILRYIGFKDRNKLTDDVILRPLITSSDVAWDTSANTITLPTNRLVLYAELLKSSTGASLPMTMLGYEELLVKRNNSYFGHSTDEVAGTGQVFYYIGSKLFTSYPTGTHSTYYDKIKVVYLSVPSAITTDVDPTLDSNCYEAMVQYALYLCFTKAKMHDKAQIHLTNFINWINK